MSKDSLTGQEMRDRTSGNDPWDEQYRLVHLPAPPEDADFAEGVEASTDVKAFANLDNLLEYLMREHRTAYLDAYERVEPPVSEEDESEDESESPVTFSTVVEDERIEDAFNVKDLPDVLGDVDDVDAIEQALEQDERKTAQEHYVRRLDELEEDNGND